MIIRDQRGFTLAELSILILIIGIVAILVTPRLSVVLSANPESVARRLSMTVRTCRERSIMSHKPYRIVVNLAKQLFYVETLSETQGTDYIFEKDTSVLHKTVKIPRSVTLMDVSSPLTGLTKEGDAYILILQDGIFPGAVVHLIDSDKNIFTITFRPLTGRMDFQKGYLYTKINEETT